MYTTLKTISFSSSSSSSSHKHAIHATNDAVAKQGSSKKETGTTNSFQLRLSRFTNDISVHVQTHNSNTQQAILLE